MKLRSRVIREHLIEIPPDHTEQTKWHAWASEHNLELMNAHGRYDWKTCKTYECLYLCGPWWRHKQMDLKYWWERNGKR